MEKKKWIATAGFLIGFVIIIFVMILDEENAGNEAVSRQQDFVSEEKSQDNKNKQLDLKEPSFADQLVNLYIMQKDQTHSDKIVVFTEGKFPLEAKTYTLHLDDIYIFIDLDAKFSGGLPQVGEEVKMVGNAKWKLTKDQSLHDYNRFKLDIYEISGPITLAINGLPPIMLKKGNPLQLQIAKSSEVSDDPVLFLSSPGPDHPSIALISPRRIGIDLHFSEKMIDLNQLHTPLPKIPGEWVNENTYRVKFGPSVSETSFDLSDVYSMSGNYLTVPQFSVRRIPQVQWRDFRTNEKIRQGKRDHFYDYLLPTPDWNKYLGIIWIQGSLGDSSGSYYAMILEEEGKDPVIINHSYFTDLSFDGLPVCWIDNDTLATGNYSELYLFNTKNGKRTSLWQREEGDPMLHEVAYDPLEKKLYALFLKDGNSKDEIIEYDRVEKWVFNMKSSTIGPPKIDEYQSDVLVTHVYEWLPIHVRENGIYWTKADADDNSVVTVFQGRDGRGYEAPGRVITADEDGAILFNQTDQGAANGYYFWRLGQQPVKIPHKNGYIKPFGPYLILVDDDLRSHRYDPRSNEWRLIENIGKGVNLPEQAALTYYKVSVSVD